MDAPLTFVRRLFRGKTTLVSKKLDFDILLRIALQSLDTWKILVRSIPDIGRWSLEHQSYVKNHFTAKREIGGRREYSLNGKLHRENGPAIERSNGTLEWYVHGERHRENGPAIQMKNGSRFWYRNGELHRKEGAALEMVSGASAWYLNGRLHREDGPAVEALSRSQFGQALYQRRGFLRHILPHCTFVKVWFRHDIIHRGYGPAIETSNGDRFWLRSGKLHREDGPEIEFASGRRGWYRNGRGYDEAERNNTPLLANSCVSQYNMS